MDSTLQRFRAVCAATARLLFTFIFAVLWSWVRDCHAKFLYSNFQIFVTVVTGLGVGLRQITLRSYIR